MALWAFTSSLISGDVIRFRAWSGKTRVRNVVRNNVSRETGERAILLRDASSKVARPRWRGSAKGARGVEPQTKDYCAEVFLSPRELVRAGL